MTSRLNELTSTQERVTHMGLDQIVSPELPDELANWLGRLALLYGVPFQHLVADARMLPTESIRWFYVDANWIEGLVDGAFSIGAHSDRDIRYHRVMQPVIRRATNVAAGMLRRTLRGTDTDADGGDADTVLDTRVRAGFLMRSAVVSGWPGLEVRAFEGSEAAWSETRLPDQLRLVESTREVDLLRMDRLSPDVLICLFAEIPGAIVVNEPAEGLHFGTDGGGVLVRRPSTGEVLDPGTTVTLPLRPTGRAGVVDIHALARALGEAAPPTGRDFGPADFAVQMVNAADKQLFTPPEVEPDD